MASADKQQKDPRIEFVKTEFGWSIRLRDAVSNKPYPPPTLAEARLAVAAAKRKAATG